MTPHRDRMANARNIGVLFGQRTQLWWDLPVRESLGLLRELIGYGTLGNHLPWLAGATHADWQGWLLTADGGLRLATLAPGGFILLGLLIAAWQAWHRPPPSH